MQTEPSDIAIALSGAVNAVLAALIAFNVGLTQTQTGAIAFAANAVFGLGWTVWRAWKNRKTPKAA